MVEIHTHEFVAGVEHRHEHSHVGLRARMRLHIGIFSTEKLLEAVLSEGLGLVNHLASAVVAVAGVSLGILVCQAGAHGFHHLVGTKFSEAISSMPFFCRACSRLIMSKIASSRFIG